MKKTFYLWLAACLGLVSAGHAQTPESLSSGEIFVRLQKLNVLGSVLYVAAHPDDENTRLLAYLSKERLYRTGYLSMTRGDGGQNLIGEEQGVELGLIRTQELLAARRIDGAEQFFTRAYDFGFSKSTEEALRVWEREKILSDVVWMIRKFQPDVIITRFPEDSRAGHGHHSASAVLAHEAFAAAADSSRFPDQLANGLRPWQAKRLLWNTFNFGGLNTTSENQLKIDVGGFNPVLGVSYGEMAAESRSQHKSQGFGIPRSRGEAFEYFSTVVGDVPTLDLMDGVETSWSRVAGAGQIANLVNKLIQDYALSHPERSVPGLVVLYQKLAQLKDSYWKAQKMKETASLIAACSGLWLEASVHTPYVAQGDKLQINITAIARLPGDLTLREIRVDGFDSSCSRRLDTDKNYSFPAEIQVASDKPISQPYWLVQPMASGSFNVSNQQQIGDAQGRPAYEVEFTVQVSGQDFTFMRPVQYKYSDAVKGEIYEPLAVLPPVTGEFEPGLLVFTSMQEKDFAVRIKKQTLRDIQPVFELTTAPGIEERKRTSFQDGKLLYTSRPLAKDQNVAYTSLVAEDHGKRDSLMDLRTISYAHIPRIDYFRPAKIKFVAADVVIAGKRIGYIEGSGDKVPEALNQMGYQVIMLKEKDINPSTLESLDAVVTGVRAYDVHDWLQDKYDVLMDFVRQGGNLIVQYNRNTVFGPQRLKTKIGPYPFTIANVRVTDENAKVSFLLPSHPVLNYPNKITDRDFEDWVQERGIYFAGQQDSAYQSILSMNDQGEPARTGSLIVADFGKGKFVYTGLDFFRELPAGVPGAYRLMANLIALNHKRSL
jgi:LmbE family N-acetylglucosaminyl deacetylase